MTANKKVPALRFKEFEGEWEQTKVGDVCDFIVPGRNKPSLFDGNIPWITTPDIIHNNIIISSKSNLAISKEEAKKVGSKVVPENSIIISCVGDLGLVAITGTEIIINQQLHAFLPREKICNRFLLYALSLQQRYMNRVATKTAVPYMNKDNCNSIPIVFPSYPEQQKIATFLTSVDNKIQQLTKKKTLLEQYKKGVMQQIFKQQIRFKDADRNDYPDWEETTLGEISDNIMYGLNSAAIPFDGYNKYIRITDIDESTRQFIPNPLTSPDGAIDVRYKVKEGDILFARTGASVGKSYLYKKKDGDLFFAGFLIKFAIQNQNPYFIYTQTLTEEYNKWVQVFSMRSGQPGINAEEYKSLEIVLPCMEEQQKIANFLTGIDNKIDLVNQQLEKTKEFKKGLLQQMFV